MIIPEHQEGTKDRNSDTDSLEHHIDIGAVNLWLYEVLSV